MFFFGVVELVFVLLVVDLGVGGFLDVVDFVVVCVYFVEVGCGFLVYFVVVGIEL